MFEQALLTTPAGTNRALSAACGVLAQSTLLTVAVLIPMVFPDTLPRVQSVVMLFTPTAPPPPPPPAAPQTQAPSQVRRPLQVTADGVLHAPVSFPDKAVMIEEEPLPPSGGGVKGGVVGGVEGGTPGGVPGSVLTSVTHAPPMPAAPPQPQTLAAPPRPVDPPRIKVGGLVQEAMIVRKVIPLYPPLARQARVSGTVQLVGIISTNGHIKELQVTGGHPMLVRAALDAVRQWIYRPTMLNGEPVEVVAPITVTFTLN